MNVRDERYCMAVRRLLALSAIGLVVPVAATAATAAPSVRIVAWASTTSKTAIPPKNAVATGTYCTARPIKRLYAFIRFKGMKNKTPSSATWYYEGDKAFVFNFAWNDGPFGRTAFDLFRTKGALEEGTYRIEIRNRGRLVGSSSVELKFAPCKS